VIYDLRAKREQLDRTIAHPEEMVGIVPQAGSEPHGSLQALPSIRQSTHRPKPPRDLASLTIGDAWVWKLREKQTPMTTREIADSLVEIGYRIKSPPSRQCQCSALPPR
jgi:hypothetical protein